MDGESKKKSREDCMRRALLTACLFAAATLPALAEETIPESARFFLSQGEWKGATLTESGHAIVADVAKSAAAAPATLFDINALADFAPTPASQKRVSDARLAAVREELERAGVALGDIAVQAVDTPGGGVPPLPPQEWRHVIIAVHY
jgi:hypothetical protein